MDMDGDIDDDIEYCDVEVCREADLNGYELYGCCRKRGAFEECQVHIREILISSPGPSVHLY